MKVIITAGGKGTRLTELAKDLPKPMVILNGKPVLEYAVCCLKRNSLTDIIITTGYKGNVIHEHLGDGSAFGVNISYFHEEEPLGSAGALLAIKDRLKEDFLLINGDIIFDMDLKKMIDFHRKKSALATLATHPNSHPYDSALIITDKEDMVTKWLNKEDERNIYKNRVNAGIHILSPELLKNKAPGKTDLDRDILKPTVSSGKLYAYDTTEYIHDMGTPERFYAVSEDITKGIVKSKNISLKQKAVFLDRDGVINYPKPFLNNWKDMELLPNAAEAIKMINNSGYLAVVITNQPVIARGECTFWELELIHNAMETLLGQKGAYVDDIFFCPHHPDKGFEGEIPEFKIDCDCRKPKPGMILKAAAKFNISLEDSFMAGDHKRDMEAGINAGCKTVFIGSLDKAPEKRDFVYEDLYGFVLDMDL